MIPRPNKGWNGVDGRELRGGGHLDESVYCVTCGTIFVPASPVRRCPACTLAAMLEAVAEELYDDPEHFWE